MPTYLVTGPDGVKYRVTAPEGATEADVRSRVQQQAASKPASHVQGFLGGLQKPAANAARFLTKINPLLNIAETLTGAPRKSIDRAERGADAAKARSPYKGSWQGELAGNIVGTLPTAFLPGGPVAGKIIPKLLAAPVVQGAAAGALSSEDTNPLTIAKNAAIGGVAGKVGQQFGKRVIAPLAERVGRTKAARTVAEQAVNVVNRVAPGRAKMLPAAPKIPKSERQIARTTPEIDKVRQNVQDAANLKLPYSLADADPRLQALGGSVARFSTDGRKLAMENYGPRSRGQADRAVNAIDEYLAPITDIEQRGAQIRQGARAASQPYYDQALAQPAPFDDQLDELLNTPTGSAAAKRAYNIALNRGVNPAEIDTVMSRASRPPNLVGDTPVSGVAPANIAADGKLYVGRAGGSHFEVMEQFPDAQFTGGTGFVNPKGEFLTRDEALAYVNSNGANVRPSSNMPGQLDSLDYREQARAVPAASPTYQSLDLIKKGLDNELNDFRNPLTQKLQLEGNEEAQAVNDLLQRYKGRLDELNPDYAQARSIYAEKIAPRTALQTGFQRLPNNAIPQRQFDAALGGMDEASLAEARRGYATAMADKVDQVRLANNPYEAVYGSPLQQGKVGALFPEGAPRFDRQYNLERDMAATNTEVLGGSQTQPRKMADEMFKGVGGDLALDFATGGVPGAQSMLKLGMRTVKDRGQLGLIGARKKADALAPQLFDTSDPNAILSFIDDLVRKQAEEETRKQAYQRTFGLLGVPAGALSVGATNP